MRVAAYGTATVALSTSILVLLISSRYWNGVPNQFQIIESIVIVFSILAILLMVFSGWVNRHPEPALLAFSACFVIGVLAIGFWWIVGGACDLEYWRHGHATCM